MDISAYSDIRFVFPVQTALLFLLSIRDIIIVRIHMIKSKHFTSLSMAIGAAILFGINAPLAKALLGSMPPTLLASFLYLGCGLGVLIFKFAKPLFNKNKNVETGIKAKDLPWLAGVILTGGVAAPIVLMFSLKTTPAATASLLLNFEAVSTALIATLFFKESLGKRVWASVAIITIAAVILTWDHTSEWGLSMGAVGIVCACLLWGADNNMTRMISLKDPLVITMVKGFGAGTVSLIISLLTAAEFPGLKQVFSALLLGAFSYGFSIVLFILALRQLGVARTSAFFGSAPFIGSIISIMVFGEIPTLQFFISLPIMIVGAILIIGEKHEHMHIHEYLQHDHMHRHDDLHHNHAHDDGFSGAHSHAHVHEAIVHSHPHMPDIHHRHKHKHTGK